MDTELPAGPAQSNMKKIMEVLGRNPVGMSSSEIASALKPLVKRTVDRHLQTLDKYGFVGIVPVLVHVKRHKGPRTWKALPISERQKRQIALNGENFALVAIEKMTSYLPPEAAATIVRLAKNARDMLNTLAHAEDEPKQKRIQATWPDRFVTLPGAFTLQSPIGDLALTNKIKDAIYQQNQMDVCYVHRSGFQSDIRNFHGLVYLHVGHTGYVVGYDGGKGPDSIRLYAVQRFKRADVLDSRFPVLVPIGFNLGTFLEHSNRAKFIAGPRQRVRLRVWDWLIPVLQESKLGCDMQITPPDATIGSVDGALVTVTIATSWQFKHWLVSCGEAIEVLEPPELRAEIMGRMSGAAARYVSVSN